MDVRDIRRQNIIALMKEHGGLFALAKLSGLSPSHLSHITGKKRSRSAGRNTSEKIEKACGKPSGWLDHMHSESEKVSGELSTKLQALLAFDGAPTLIPLIHPKELTSSLGVKKLDYLASEALLNGEFTLALPGQCVSSNIIFATCSTVDLEKFSVPRETIILVEACDILPQESLTLCIIKSSKKLSFITTKNSEILCSSNPSNSNEVAGLRPNEIIVLGKVLEVRLPSNHFVSLICSK